MAAKKSKRPATRSAKKPATRQAKKGAVRKPGGAKRTSGSGRPRARVQKPRGEAKSGSLFDRIALSKAPESHERGRVRLNQYIAQCGVASRRGSDELIAQGRVTVNGEVTTELGTKVDPIHDRIVVDDRVLEREKPTYVLLHKPQGFVCTNATHEQKPRAVDLLASVKGRLFSVGRLDVDSEGLILFTNDGDFSERMTHPRYGVPKNYEVVVRGRVEYEKLDKLRGGVWLAEGKTSGARIRIKRRGAERSYLDVEIREGKNREVRRMFSRIGYPVLRLKRTRIGPVTIRGLAKGRYRFLTKPEIDGLLAAASADGETEVAAEREATRQRRRRGR
ncbi:MAG: rRNA pseudouridine synthase [Planctomycetes bacterium]|nr:rRNA pseudouridine synthase [Planctomycetota bacterium]MCB9919562.1 rRNA pseudouridine synthase [Planctomycetota bacterium]